MTTYVLLHGSCQGGWIWLPVAERLRAEGHTVYAPSLDGCGDRRATLRPGITTESQAAEIVDLLFFEDLRDVVLVGTSSGGMVACRVAECARDRIGRIVMVDALALLDGESVADHVNRPKHVRTEVGTGPSREDAATRMLASLDPETKEWALDRITPHPIAAMDLPVKLESFWSEQWDATVIWCRQSVNPPLVHQRRTADLLNAEWVELDTDHFPMLTKPKELARLLMSK